MATSTKPRPAPAEIPAETTAAHQSQYDPALLLDSIEPHPKNIRHDATADQELVDSITAQGLLEPLLVAPHPDGTVGGFVLIAGHRRRDGLLRAGFTHGPAIIRLDLTDEADQVAAMLVENGRRADLTPLEEAEGYGQLRLFGWKPGAIAKAAGHNVDTINRRLKLLKLDEKVQKTLHDGQLSLEDAVTISEFPAAQQKTLTKAAGTAMFRYELEQAKQRRTAAARHEKLLRTLEHDGVPARDMPKGLNAPWQLRDADHGMVPLSQTFSRDHGDHPECLAYVITRGHYGPDVDYVCTDVAGHDEQLDEQRRATQAAADETRRLVEERERAQVIARNLRVDAVLGSIKPGAKVDPAVVELIRVLTLQLINNLQGSMFAVPGGGSANRYFEISNVAEDQRWGISRLWSDEDRGLFRRHVDEHVNGSTATLLRTFATLTTAHIEGDVVDHVETMAATKTLAPRESLNTAAAWLRLAEGAGHALTDVDLELQAAAAAVDEVPT